MSSFISRCGRLGGLVVAAGAAVLPAVGAAPAPAPGIPGYKLVWSDEFDKDGLPDPAKWIYEEGYVRNNEAQFYTRARKENVRVEGGNLVIEGRKEQYAIPAGAPATKGRTTADYTSGSIKTKGKASWTYGRIEVRAKLPHGLGTWPAIWTVGDAGHWPKDGEIDIMEFVGHTPDKVHATLHWQKEGKHASKGQALTVDKPWEDFHVYAVEWTSEKMEFYYDEKMYHSYDLKLADENGDNPFRHPQLLILNLALGGAWGGRIDDSILPQQFLIDYVRVYQKDEAAK